MLFNFLIANRQAVITHCRKMANQRLKPADVPVAIDQGVTLFLGQLIDTLRREHVRSRQVSDVADGPSMAIGESAALHGAEFLRLGYSVDQVVHEYGDICQSVTALAIQHNLTIAPGEFQTLNRCLDDAIADAVTSFAKASAALPSNDFTSVNGRLRTFGDEHEHLLDIANHAYSAIKSGKAGISGSTAMLLVDTLDQLRVLTKRAVTTLQVLITSASSP